MPTKVIKEGNVRSIFKDVEFDKKAMEWLDTIIENMLKNAYERIDVRKVKRIDKEIIEFALLPNSIIVINGDEEKE